MEINQNNQRKLMELAVGSVLKKHNVNPKKSDLSVKEKRKIKKIVGKIENEVQRFLEAENKKVTEFDFHNITNESKSETKSSRTKKILNSPNDMNTVKTFLNQKKQ